MTTRLPQQDLDHRQSPYSIDLEDASEAARLTILSRIITRHLDELVPEALRHRSDIQVLDVGCGPGGWVRALYHAFSYPWRSQEGLERRFLGQWLTWS